MPDITPETPRKAIQVGGVILSAPTPYTEGHVLTANEAAALNQTYLENLGNNFRSVADKSVKFAAATRANDGKEPTEDQLKNLPETALKSFKDAMAKEGGQKLIDTNALQTAFDEAVAAYEFGVRRSSSVEIVDPVLKEARSMVKSSLKKALQKKNIKLNQVKAEWYDREIAKVLAEDSPLRAKYMKGAERRVAVAKQVAEESLDEINLDNPAEAAA